MSPHELERAAEVYAALRRMPTANRSAWLDKACRNEPSVRAAVEEMLAADRERETRSAADSVSVANTAMPDAAPPAAPPTSADQTAGADAARAQPHRDLIPPGYAYVQTLGEGGQGVVYLATQASTGRRVAIKVLHGASHASGTTAQRFEREVRVLAALDHPNIVSIIDRGTLASGPPFLVMEYVSGIPLTAWITRAHTTPASTRAIGTAVQLFLKICDAVNVAHVRGITHRDLKPANILVDERDEPHILDFGLALVSVDTAADPLSPISMTGQFMGSLPWASPEQANCQSDKVDPRSDVYSLGVILFQIVTGGRFPYAVAGTMKEVLDNIITATPPPPSSIAARPPVRVTRLLRWHPGAGVNREMDAVVLKALSKRRDDRYPNAGELGRDIARYLAGKPTTATATVDADQRKHRRLTAMIAVTLLVGVAWATIVSMRHRNRATVEASRPTPTTAASQPANAPSPGPSKHPQRDVSLALRICPHGRIVTPPDVSARPDWAADDKLRVPLEHADWSREPDSPPPDVPSTFRGFSTGRFSLGAPALRSRPGLISAIDEDFVLALRGRTERGAWGMCLGPPGDGISVVITSDRCLVIGPASLDQDDPRRPQLPMILPLPDPPPATAPDVDDQLRIRVAGTTLEVCVNGARMAGPIDIGPRVANPTLWLCAVGGDAPSVASFDEYSLWAVDAMVDAPGARLRHAIRMAKLSDPQVRIETRPESAVGPDWASAEGQSRLGPPDATSIDWATRPDDAYHGEVRLWCGFTNRRYVVSMGGSGYSNLHSCDLPANFTLDVTGTSVGGGWGVGILDTQAHGVVAYLARGGCLIVSPIGTDKDAERRTQLPIAVPLPIPDPAESEQRMPDRLTLQKIGHSLWVCVNGQLATGPLDLGPSIGTGRFAFFSSGFSTAPSHAMFDGFKMWSLERPATAPAGDHELATTGAATTSQSAPPARSVAQPKSANAPDWATAAGQAALGLPLRCVDWTAEPDDPIRALVAGYVGFRGGHLAHGASGAAQLDVARVNGDFVFELAGTSDRGTWGASIHDGQRHGVHVSVTQERNLLIASTWYDVATHVRPNFPIVVPLAQRPAGQMVDRLTIRKDRNVLNVCVNGVRVAGPVNIGPDLAADQSLAIYSAAEHPDGALASYDGYQLWGTNEQSVQRSMATRAADARHRASELWPRARVMDRPDSTPAPEWATTAALDRLGPPSHAADWTGRDDDRIATRIDGFTGIRGGRMAVGTSSAAELQVSPADQDFILDLCGTSARGAWGFSIHDDANHGYEVVVTNERCVVVTPAPYDTDAPRRAALPVIVPMPLVRGPRTVDRLTVRKAGTHLEICLNGERVCDPLDIGPDVARAQFAALAVAEDQKPGFAAFERFRMWPAPRSAGK